MCNEMKWETRVSVNKNQHGSKRTAAYFLTGLAGVLGTVLFVVWSLHTWNDMKKPVQNNSPYQDVAGVKSPAWDWAQRFVGTGYGNSKNWAMSTTSQPTQPVDSSVCSNLGMVDKNVLATFSGSDDNTSVFADVYAPGQAVNGFVKYKNLFNVCQKTSTVSMGDPATTVVSYTNSFFFTYGDVLVFVNSKNKNNLDALKKFYVQRAADTLKTNGCLSLTVTPADVYRNIFAAGNKYTGLIVHDQVQTTVNIHNFPTVVFPVVKNYQTMNAPEGPLPNGFDMPSTALSIPSSSLPDLPTLNGTTQPVQYQTDDVNGPGCGWKWIGSKAPVVDQNSLNQKKKDAYTKAQMEADKNGENYSSSMFNVTAQTMTKSDMIEKWNAYVNQVKSVQAKWQWLEQQRESIQPAWNSYVQNHDNWMNFDTLKQNAIDEYNAEVTDCNNRNNAVQQWHNTWDKIIASAQPSVVPGTPTISMVTPSAVVQPGSVSTVTETPAPSASSTDQPSVIVSTAPAQTIQPTPYATTITPPDQTIQPTVSVPAMPQGCDVAPQKPEIIDEDKPTEPQAPKLPKNVTIPNSWPQPITAPNVQPK